MGMFLRDTVAPWPVVAVSGRASQAHQAYINTRLARFVPTAYQRGSPTVLLFLVIFREKKKKGNSSIQLARTSG